MAGTTQARQPVEVSGRVRAAATMLRPGGGGRCVVATTWQSDRVFPRTAGEAVPFEVETTGGEVFAVNPLGAAVALPVRERAADGGVRRESGWIAPGDEVRVAGDVVEARNGKPARILAHKILAPATGASASPHRLPPRTLSAGRAEKDAAPAVKVAAAHQSAPPPAAAQPTPPAPSPTPTTSATPDDPPADSPAASLTPSAAPAAPAATGPGRRRKPLG